MKSPRRPSVPRAILLVSLLLGGVLAAKPRPAAGADAPGQSETAAAPSSATGQVVAAANAFLATLDDKQRAKVLFAFDNNEQRARWSNFPTGFVPRAGLSLKDLNDAQRSAAMSLLSATLSRRGLEKVEQIMAGDEVLKSQPDQGPPGGPRGGGPRDDHARDGQPRDDKAPGGGPGGPPRDGGNGPRRGGPPPFGNGGQMFGQDLYYISFLGAPSEKDPWMLQFGGHHLALNITVVGEHGILTPTLTGAQPSLYEVGGKTVRPLGPENDKAFALLNALDETQRKQAILNYRVADLVLGPGHDGQTIQPEGLKVSTMNDTQRALLLDVISEWVGIANDAYAAPRMAEIKSGLDDTWFAWSGPTTCEPGKNGSSYYRIQGPKLVIEFSPQPIGGDLTMHVHTMYRDPTNDYGRALVPR